MAYRTGTSSSCRDIVTQIHNLAVTLGWSVLAYNDNNGTLIIRPPDGSMNYSIKASQGLGTEGDLAGNSSSPPVVPSNTGFYLLGALGHNPAQSWQNQPDSSVYSTRYTQNSQLLNSPSRYWLFGTSTYMHVVVKSSARRYCHMVMGTFDKKGMVYPGGQYVAGGGGGWLFNDSINVLDYMHTGRLDGRALWSGVWTTSEPDMLHPDGGLVAASANAMTADTVINPARAITSQLVGGRRRYVGDVPDFSTIRLQNCAPEDILLINSEEWQVFPAWQLGRDKAINPNTGAVMNTREQSGTWGYAYRIRR